MLRAFLVSSVVVLVASLAAPLVVVPLVMVMTAPASTATGAAARRETRAATPKETSTLGT